MDNAATERLNLVPNRAKPGRRHESSRRRFEFNFTFFLTLFFFAYCLCKYKKQLKRKEVKEMEKDNGQWITLQPGVQFYMQVQEKKEDIAFDEWCKSRK